MASPPMPRDELWRIMDAVAHAGDDPDRRVSTLRTTLDRRPIEDVAAFELTFRRLAQEAYSWDLWGAAYVIHGGCSDDGFEYFLHWLIHRGQRTYDAALADPDSLADLDHQPAGPEGSWQFEEIYAVAFDVFASKGGDIDALFDFEAESAAAPREPSGEAFIDDDEHLKSRYPKLWRRFGDDPLL